MKIGTNALTDVLHQMAQEGYVHDMSFVINHLSFGLMDNFTQLKQKYPDTDIKHPLDHYQFSAETTTQSYTGAGGKVETKKIPKSVQTSFFINAVPSLFDSNTEVFQLHVVEESMPYQGENVIEFQYRIQ